MSKIVVMSSEELREILEEAVQKGIRDYKAQSENSYPAEMNDNQAAAYLGISPITLRCWRTQKIGPKYHKLGRTVRYSRKSLDEWVRQKEVLTIDSLEARREISC